MACQFIVRHVDGFFLKPEPTIKAALKQARKTSKAAGGDRIVVQQSCNGSRGKVYYHCTGGVCRRGGGGFAGLEGLGARRKNGRKNACKFGVSKTTGKCLKRPRRK